MRRTHTHTQYSEPLPGVCVYLTEVEHPGPWGVVCVSDGLPGQDWGAEDTHTQTHTHTDTHTHR